jgi:hypothetical protein
MNLHFVNLLGQLPFHGAWRDVRLRWKTLMLVHVDAQNLMMMLPMTKEASEKHSSRIRLKCMYARMCWCRGGFAAFHLLLFAVVS